MPRTSNHAPFLRESFESDKKEEARSTSTTALGHRRASSRGASTDLTRRLAGSRGLDAQTGTDQQAIHGPSGLRSERDRKYAPTSESGRWMFMVQAGPWMHTHHMARIDRAGLPSSVTSSVGGRHIDPQIFEGMRMREQQQEASLQRRSEGSRSFKIPSRKQEKGRRKRGRNP